MTRWAEPEEKLKSVGQIIAVIALEVVRHVIKRKLSADTDIDPLSMRQVAHISNCVTRYWKDFLMIDFVEHELVSGFFHALVSRVNGIASALVIGFE